ncbi:hypothetical protein HMPREF9370_1426 [Neisseria wadsworthii 9715]|uniref:Uncharacterized protein n=1 Tax=Neisseria wadsworthii 9715 TaxID=1030841 RepID=G4CQR6_9NEIS|nr:hypothetical protein HMPREF9370_1426 [Neisseria wadsworthii 9715]
MILALGEPLAVIGSVVVKTADIQHIITGLGRLYKPCYPA